MKYLKLIRIQNILLIAFAQWAFRFFLIKPYFDVSHFPHKLNEWQYALLILATALIAAGGYVINDFFDIDTDAINKPGKNPVGDSISEDTISKIYFILSGLGLAISIYLCYTLHLKDYIAFFVFSAVMLWFYSADLKQKPFIGNLIIAMLAGLSFVIVWMFERTLFELTEYYDLIQISRVVYYQMIAYTFFAFITTLIREIVKDFEDQNGDENTGGNTLPICLGNFKTKFILGLFYVLYFIGIGYIMYSFMSIEYIKHELYLGLLLVLPMIYSMYLSINKSDYSMSSKMIKWTIFFGILSMPVFYFFNKL